MSANFTPGPWVASAIGPDLPLTRVGASKPSVGGGFDWHCVALLAGTRPNAETNTNARLIAAAPDLLEVVETIELGLKRGYTPADLLDENSPIRDRLRAAIAKVEAA